jgi:hypothetical protein
VTALRSTARPTDFLPLATGLLVLAAGTAFGWNARFVEALVAPPPILRAALVGVAIVVGGALLVGGLRRVEGAPADGLCLPDLRRMLRGIRLVFLAVAAFAAAAGWLIGHPLPIVIALVIAGVDVIETSLLLLVVRRPGQG